MKYRKFFIFLCIAFLFLSSSIWSVGKNNIDITEVDNSTITDLRVRPSLSSADTCIVRHDEGIALRIGNWVEGNELYKSYMDPSLTCTTPYPFTVTEVVIPMWFFEATSIIVSVDVEQVDNTDPNCPFPGPILGLSSTWQYDIPGGGLYNLAVPFDDPVVVNDPFFAGFFIGEISNPNCSASVVTDENALSKCVSYNVWDDSTVFNDTVKFVDLMDVGFPGQLVLYASGIPGGVPVDPAPELIILTPNNNDSLYKTVNFWVNETSGSTIIDYVSFSYSSGSDFIEIGRDYDGTKTFRDGISPSNNANGYSLDWDFSSLTEGDYTIRATSVDTLGRSFSADIILFLEPTPPIAEIITPELGANFCPQFDILMTSNDDNLNFVSMSYKQSEPNFSINAQALLLSDFGEFYSSAIAATLAMQALHDRGGINLMRDGLNSITPTQMAYKMADHFLLETNNGVYDENVFQGLKEFNSSVGYRLIFGYHRNPDYLHFREEMEINGKAIIIALGGTTNDWLLIDGFFGTAAFDGSYQITLSNPLTSIIDTVKFRNTSVGGEIFYNGNWQHIDVSITIGDLYFSKELTFFGIDFNRNDGWAFNWNPPDLWQGNDYFIQSKGTDESLLEGFHTTMLSYDCTQFYLAGDFNNDSAVDINDLGYLIDYFINQGTPPVGGDGRADTNCDGYLNITDIIYYANFIFGLAPEPCY